MDIKQAFKLMPGWQGINDFVLAQCLDAADVIECDDQELLTIQYHPAEYFYFVHNGDLCFGIQLDKPDSDLEVARAGRDWCAVGWSGFLEPNRYATTVKCNQSCQALRWHHRDLINLFEQNPSLGYAFLMLVLQTCGDLLHQARQRLVGAAKSQSSIWRTYVEEPPHRMQLDADTVLAWLQRSTFFAGFNEDDLKYIASHVVLEQYTGGSCIATDTEAGSGLYMLVSGSAAHYFSLSKRASEKGTVFIRTLDNPGQIVAWKTGYSPLCGGLITVTSRDTLLCYINEDWLNQRSEISPEFGLTLARRMLYLTGSQLRSTRVQLLNQQYEEEQFSIRNMLEQVSPQLGVTSPLHEVPHLLNNRLTHGKVFDLLTQLKSQGSSLEKNLAGLSMDILKETRREWHFYRGLLKVYETAASSSDESSTPEIRSQCESILQETFSNVRYVIEGQEYLPDGTGHIFILNHLISHPYHILPNHFELALDTHFVSAMILNPKYGDGGVRIVRLPRNDEFAHQNYYRRLGNISVVTSESDQRAQTVNNRHSRLQEFIKIASDSLLAGNNLVMCPEGTSLWSEQSPGSFKPGAFILAGKVNPEPLIVPIAVANFDKRLRHAALAAIIKPAFYISDYVDINNRQQLSRFLMEYQDTYRGYVKEAQHLASQLNRERY